MRGVRAFLHPGVAPVGVPGHEVREEAPSASRFVIVAASRRPALSPSDRQQTIPPELRSAHAQPAAGLRASWHVDDEGRLKMRFTAG